MVKKAIIVLGGGMIKNPDGTWRTTTYQEKDQFGALGDWMRVLATGYLYKENYGQIIFVLGGKGQLKDVKDAPPVAEVIKKELLAMGVSPDHIITETQSGNTLEQLLAFKKIVQEYGLESIVIISNRYHLPRIDAMLKNSALKNVVDTCNISLQEAEQIVIDHEPEQKEKIEKAYESQAIQDRIALENKGVKDIYEGRYKLK